MSTAHREIADAYRAGRESWLARGVDVPNPWNGRAETPRERVLSVAWRRGRLAGVDPAFRAATA